MTRKLSALGWLGRLSGIVGLVSLGVSLVVLIGFFVVGADSLGLPQVSQLVYLIPFVFAAGGIGLWILSKLALRFLGSSSGSDDVPESGGSDSGKTEAARNDPSVALRSFGKANFYLASIFAVLFVVGVQSGTVTSLLAGTPLAVLGGFLVFAVTLLGGTTVQLVNLAVFGGAWYGMRRYEATEAWLLGMIGWGLLAASGLALLSRSLGAIAIVIGGLQVLRTGYRARDATTTWYLDEYVSELTRESTAGKGRRDEVSGSTTARATGGRPVSDITQQLSQRDLRNPDELKALVDVDPEFVHPTEAETDRLTYWSYLSYLLGTLTVLSSLLVGISLWGFPNYGPLGVVVGAVYLAHGFALPQESSFIHVGGVVWYVFMLVAALVTISPLAILATAGGVYLGWTATPGIKQPEEVLGDLSAGGDGGGLVGGGMVGGAILGLGLGVIGAVVFAAVSVQTKTVYGLLVLLPAVAGGFGVALGIGGEGTRLSGAAGAGAALVSVLLGFRLLSWWMPRGYELQGDPVLLVVPLIGIVIAYQIGRRSATETATDETMRPTGPDETE